MGTLTDDDRIEKLKHIAVSSPLCVNPCITCKFRRKVHRKALCTSIISKAEYANPSSGWRHGTYDERDQSLCSVDYMRSALGLCGPHGLLWQPTLLRRIQFWKE